MDIVLIVVIVIVVVLVIAAIALYNNLVKLRNMVDNAWAQIDVQLQRRLDLIPNLVETVKGYASHERGTLDEVTEARAAVVNAGTPAGKMEADNMLTGALKSLFAVAEAYPEISYMRQSYNDTVMKYNTAIQTFPAVLFAGMMGFSQRESFDAAAGSDVAPKVQF